MERSEQTSGHLRANIWLRVRLLIYGKTYWFGHRKPQKLLSFLSPIAKIFRDHIISKIWCSFSVNLSSSFFDSLEKQFITNKKHMNSARDIS